MVLNKKVSHKLADPKSKMAAGLPGQEENLSPLLRTWCVLFVGDFCKYIVFIFNCEMLFEQTAYITYMYMSMSMYISMFMSMYMCLYMYMYMYTVYAYANNSEGQVTESYFMSSANSEATVHRRGFPILHLLSLHLCLHDNCVA